MPASFFYFFDILRISETAKKVNTKVLKFNPLINFTPDWAIVNFSPLN